MLFSNFLTFGGHKAVVRPVPIPNTAVKRSLADGSGCIASARVGCCQIFQSSRNESFGFFYPLDVSAGTVRFIWLQSPQFSSLCRSIKKQEEDMQAHVDKIGKRLS